METKSYRHPILAPNTLRSGEPTDRCCNMFADYEEGGGGKSLFY